jgi:hypothetical protein
MGMHKNMSRRLNFIESSRADSRVMWRQTTNVTDVYHSCVFSVLRWQPCHAVSSSLTCFTHEVPPSSRVHKHGDNANVKVTSDYMLSILWGSSNWIHLFSINNPLAQLYTTRLVMTHPANVYTSVIVNFHSFHSTYARIICVISSRTQLLVFRAFHCTWIT